jgi:hypothetical protein
MLQAWCEGYGPMRVFLWLALLSVISTPTFADDIDLDKLAQAEREQLALCMSDTMKVIEKHHVSSNLFVIWDLFEATCGAQIERVKLAAARQLKDELQKKILPDGIILSMVNKAEGVLEQKPFSSCSGAGCSLQEYSACLIRQMPAAIRSRTRPIDFERQAQQQCGNSESAARNALNNDFGDVLRRHSAGGLDRKMNDAIGNMLAGSRQAVVVLYGDDLRKVQPERKSCRPKMCGAAPCSLDQNESSEYECVINQ